MLRTGFKMEEDKGNGGGGGADDAAIVQEATEMGWVPEEKWTGPKERWVDAKTFVERGSVVLPIVLSKNKQLQEQVRLLSQQVKDVQSSATEYRSFLEGSIKQKYEKLLLAELQKKADAITNGDGAAVIEAEQNVDELQRKQQEELNKAAPKGAQGGQNGTHPDFDSWLAENEWFKDSDLEALAESQAYRIQRKAAEAKQPIPIGKELWDAAKKEVMRLRPDAFETTAPIDRTAGGRETSHAGPSRGGKGRTYNDLPPEAKAACDRFVANKWTTREQYVKDYSWD
jgi:hypothetical protein